MKSKDIRNNKLDKLKKTYKNDMKNENDYFLKTEAETATGEKEKLRSKTKNQNNRNSEKQVWLLSTVEIASVQKMGIQQQATKTNNLPDQSQPYTQHKQT